MSDDLTVILKLNWLIIMENIYQDLKKIIFFLNYKLLLVWKIIRKL